MVNLALFLHSQGKRVAVVDMNSAFPEKLKRMIPGSVPTEFYGDLAEIRSSASSRFRRTFFISHPDRFSFFPAHELQDPLEICRDAAIKDFLLQIQAGFEVVLINLPPGIAHIPLLETLLQETRGPLGASKNAVLVTSPEIRTVTELDRVFKQFPSLRYSLGEQLLIVFNMVSRGIEEQNIDQIQLGVSDIRSVLHFPVTLSVPYLSEIPGTGFPLILGATEQQTALKQSLTMLGRMLGNLTEESYLREMDPETDLFRPPADPALHQSLAPLLYQIKNLTARKLFINPDSLNGFLEQDGDLLRVRIRLTNRIMKDFPFRFDLDYRLQKDTDVLPLPLFFTTVTKVGLPAHLEFIPKPESHRIAVQPVYHFDDRFAAQTQFNLSPRLFLHFDGPVHPFPPTFEHTDLSHEIPSLSQLLGYRKKDRPAMPLRDPSPDTYGFLFFFPRFPSEFRFQTDFLLKSTDRFLFDAIPASITRPGFLPWRIPTPLFRTRPTAEAEPRLPPLPRIVIPFPPNRIRQFVPEFSFTPPLLVWPWESHSRPLLEPSIPRNYPPTFRSEHPQKISVQAVARIHIVFPGFEPDLPFGEFSVNHATASSPTAYAIQGGRSVPPAPSDPVFPPFPDRFSTPPIIMNLSGLTTEWFFTRETPSRSEGSRRRFPNLLEISSPKRIAAAFRVFPHADSPSVDRFHDKCGLFPHHFKISPWFQPAFHFLPAPPWLSPEAFTLSALPSENFFQAPTHGNPFRVFTQDIPIEFSVLTSPHQWLAGLIGPRRGVSVDRPAPAGSPPGFVLFHTTGSGSENTLRHVTQESMGLWKMPRREELETQAPVTTSFSESMRALALGFSDTPAPTSLPTLDFLGKNLRSRDFKATVPADMLRLCTLATNPHVTVFSPPFHPGPRSDEAPPAPRLEGFRTNPDRIHRQHMIISRDLPRPRQGISSFTQPSLPAWVFQMDSPPFPDHGIRDSMFGYFPSEAWMQEKYPHFVLLVTGGTFAISPITQIPRTDKPPLKTVISFHKSAPPILFPLAIPSRSYPTHTPSLSIPAPNPLRDRLLMKPEHIGECRREKPGCEPRMRMNVWLKTHFAPREGILPPNLTARHRLPTIQALTPLQKALSIDFPGVVEILFQDLRTRGRRHFHRPQDSHLRYQQPVSRTGRFFPPAEAQLMLELRRFPYREKVCFSGVRPPVGGRQIFRIRHSQVSDLLRLGRKLTSQTEKLTASSS